MCGIAGIISLQLDASIRDDAVEPVLVLDDVFAELDSTRRERLASSVVSAEPSSVAVLIRPTCNVPSPSDSR